jgi:hypothetical protein
MHLHAAARPCWNRRSGGTVTSFREHRRRDVLVAALLPVDALLRGATAPTRRFLGRRRTLTHQRTGGKTAAPRWTDRWAHAHAHAHVHVHAHVNVHARDMS